MLFFTPPREHFFRPLTHDNREICAAVLRRLHERVHGANADYAEVLTREVVLQVVLQALADPALRTLAFPPGRTASAARRIRSCSGWHCACCRKPNARRARGRCASGSMRQRRRNCTPRSTRRRSSGTCC
jgi:hypothetical protein